MIKKLSIAGGSTLLLSVCVWVGFVISSDFDAASVSEILAVTDVSECAKRVLQEANRDARLIKRRDLSKVSEMCGPIDRQSLAFAN